VRTFLFAVIALVMCAFRRRCTIAIEAFIDVVIRYSRARHFRLHLAARLMRSWLKKQESRPIPS
jgi:hypothetical protein